PAPKDEGGAKKGFEFADNIDAAISGGAKFFFNLLRTFYALTVRRREFLRVFIADAPHTSEFVRPATFLALAALPGSIFLQAVVLAGKRDALTYTGVSTSMAQLLSQELTAARVIAVSIPIVAVTYICGLLLAAVFKTKPDQDVKSKLTGASCYAFGYALVWLAMANILPLVLRSILPLEETFPGLLIKHPLPLWARLIGMPLGLFGLWSVGRILVLAVVELRNNVLSKGNRTAIHLVGYAGIYAAAAATWLSTAIDMRALIDADTGPHAPDHTNIFCRGRSLDVSSDGRLQWVFTIENTSDEPLFLTRKAPKIVLRHEAEHATPPISGARIASWEAGEADVLKVAPKERAWAVVVAEIPTETVGYIREQQKIPGGGKMFHVDYIAFNAVIHSNYVCNAQYAFFPKIEKPSLLVTHDAEQ
ncbi:hypothetical protein, partial [Corallococcus sp. AB030]|uniref:hypothetical protein n=1 Tax=Corallococcus sp. AB030 TaxID=2316716 RepID=UPI00131578CA